MRVENSLIGIEKLKEQLVGGAYLIALESSGRYEALVRHELEAAGYRVRVKNPRLQRRLAEGLGRQAKTDGIDAKCLAETAKLGRTGEPRSKTRESLGDISRTIEALKKDRTGHLKRIQMPGFSQIAIRSLKATIEAIDTQIKKLEREFVKLVRKSPLADRYRLALGVEGIGPACARIAVCELPENLHNWSVRQLSSYAGVAAIDHSSGNCNPPARVPSHGNGHLKGALYMPAISLLASQDWAKKLYARLTARGLTHQQAIIAVMHKLLLHLVAVLKRGSPWQDEPPKKA